jgi:predicted RNA-binding Zn-ribbon protein involved in translation (DUF1610 family)
MINTFPPNGFVPTESAVEGITVFMPAPPAPTEHQEVVEFKCPNCGANQAYSAADQSLTCTACGYREVPRQPVVGKMAEQFEFKVETLQQSAHGWGVERKEMQCKNCGALLSIPPDSMTHTCPFCTSNFIVQQKASQDLLRPHHLIPPKVTDQACRDLIPKWLSSSWMTPHALRGDAVLDRLMPIYLPFWTFDAKTAADWRAEVGHTHTTGSGKNRRTYTTWRWESGHVDLFVDDLLVSGTLRVSEKILKQVSNFSTTELVPYDSAFLAGISTLAYERNLEQAWELGRQEMRETTKKACYKQMSSSKVRNFSMQMDFNNESWRYVLLPVYATAYQFEDKVFQVLVNGQTGKVGGQRPVSWYKVGPVLAILAILTLVGVILPFATFGSNDATWILAIAIAIGGFMAIWYLVKTAVALDDA